VKFLAKLLIEKIYVQIYFHKKDYLWFFYKKIFASLKYIQENHLQNLNLQEKISCFINWISCRKNCCEYYYKIL